MKEKSRSLTVDPEDGDCFRQSDDEDAPAAAVSVHQLQQVATSLCIQTNGVNVEVIMNLFFNFLRVYLVLICLDLLASRPLGQVTPGSTIRTML